MNTSKRISAQIIIKKKNKKPKPYSAQQSASFKNILEEEIKKIRK